MCVCEFVCVCAREKQTLLNKLNLQHEILSVSLFVSASVVSDSVVCVCMQFYAYDVMTCIGI